MTDTELYAIKKQFLFNDEGMIRPGLISMTDYAKIVNANDEEELNEIILEIIASHKAEGESEDDVEIDTEEE